LPVIAAIGIGITVGSAPAAQAQALYVSNSGDNTIEKFTNLGAASLFASSGLNLNRGLAFDRSGNLYAANYSNSTIEKFTPGGVGSFFPAPV
jgi:DNA-binding beta-propeller fold protein YncE